jgi:hypothetical protein
MTGQAPETAVTGLFGRERLQRPADVLATALVVSLPWSTTATSILVVLWLLAVLPTLDVAAVRREVLSPAGGLPVLLWLLGVAGTLWADVSWSERLHGLGSFHKLLVVPLLLAQFRRSGNGAWAIRGFLVSCAVLLVLSWILWLWPTIPWQSKELAIPVKDRISQGSMFTICILVLIYLVLDHWRKKRSMAAIALALLTLAFLLNILFVATSRTALVTIPVLLALLGAFRSGWKGAVGLPALVLLVAGIVWSSSSYLQERVLTLFDEIREYRIDAPPTPAGERLYYWRTSLNLVSAAPWIGHGTGSIREQFRRAVVVESGVGATVPNNPHSQVFAVAIQLGLLGTAVLLIMWLAHLLLFRAPGLAAWIGLVAAGQNIVGSMFNSHLFDFTHGWVYVVGVGIAGGIVLRQQTRTPQQSQEPL